MISSSHGTVRRCCSLNKRTGFVLASNCTEQGTRDEQNLPDRVYVQVELLNRRLHEVKQTLGDGILAR